MRQRRDTKKRPKGMPKKKQRKDAGEEIQRGVGKERMKS